MAFNGGDAFKFRSNKYPLEYFRFLRTLFLAIISIGLLYFAGHAFLQTGCIGALLLPGATGLLAAVGAIGSLARIEYFEYTVDKDKISMKTVYGPHDQPRETIYGNAALPRLCWEFINSLVLAISGKPRTEYAFKNIAGLDEDFHNNSRTLIISERGFITPRGGARVRIYLPDSEADKIISELRARVQDAATR